jgi:hypothetical protein
MGVRQRRPAGLPAANRQVAATVLKDGDPADSRGFALLIHSGVSGRPPLRTETASGTNNQNSNQDFEKIDLIEKKTQSKLARSDH